MPKVAPTKTARRPSLGKSGGRKTPNRFANLAGGDDVEPTIANPNGEELADRSAGLIGAMSAVGEPDATRVVRLPVAEVAPHPFNDPARSAPQPGDEKWEELLNGVRKNGVLLPVLAVPRTAFLNTRPGAAKQIPDDARYVLVYGHRRRAAALAAGRDTIPAVVDESILDDNGDLDAMATENLGRQDLSNMAEATLFARYYELGLVQEDISARLGVHQSTVSRRLALFLMAPELLEALDGRRGDGRKLKQTEATTIVGALPYGPVRPWQTSPDPEEEQNSDTRREEQIAALNLVLQRGMTGSAAATWVEAARSSRAQAAEWGVPIVDDPRVELGERFYEYRVAGFDGRPGLIAALDPALGTLVLYRRPAEDSTSGHNPDSHSEPDESSWASEPDPEDDPGTSPSSDRSPDTNSPTAERGSDSLVEKDDEATSTAAQRRADAAAAAAAQAHRRRACAALINVNVTNTDLLRVLVGQYLSGVAARSGTSAVTALLNDWDASCEGNGDKARATRAWHRAIAAAELHTTELKDKAWDADAVAHVRMLVDRVGYQPTAWEQTQLDLVP